MKLLSLRSEASESLLSLLDENVIGTPGESIVYQQLDTRGKIKWIKKPYFLNLERNGKVIATCTFCERLSKINEAETSSFYVRYFTFLSAYRTNNKTTSPKKVKKSTLQTEIYEVLNGNRFKLTNNKGYTYAYVDPKNSRSAVLCKDYGFESIGSFDSFLFGRLFPKNRINFKRINDQHKPKVKNLLDHQYSKYNSYSDENLFINDNYYFIDNAGEIEIGLQANPVRWSIKSLGGSMGKPLLEVMNYIPILNRLIRKKHSFLAIDYLYCPLGHEHQLALLLESLLHKFNCYSVLILADHKSTNHNLVSRLDKGLISIFKKPTTINTIVKPINLSPDELQNLKKTPTFVSSFDTT